MAGIANIDPDFEPQSRPRSCTWPMKRPNIGNQQDNENDISMKLEPTIEEVESQDQLLIDSVLHSDVTNIKQDPQDSIMLSGFPTSEFGNSSAVDSLSNYTNILTPSQPSSTMSASDLSNNSLSYMNLDPLPQPTISNYGALNLPRSSQSITENTPSFLSETSASPISHPLHSASSNCDSTVTTSPAIAKPKSSSRKNAWGNMSYADLITQGIESSPDKRLTLAQIYDWMVKNVPYFKDKGDSNSSAGWKNSIRHNLSLHAKFKRIQNEGTGKSSWWVINHDAKPGKPNRRRTTSLDTSNPKFKQSRAKALGKKSEMLKKQKSCSKRDSPQAWGKSGAGPDGLHDFEHHSLNKSLLSEYRPRTSSNASSIGGRISPSRSVLTQDLEDDGPPPLSPLSSSSFAAPTNNLDLFKMDPFSNLVGDFESMQSTELHEGFNFDSAITQSPSSKVSMYLNSTQSNKSQLHNVVNSTSNSNKGVLSTPNLASLLQQGNGNQQQTKQFQTLTNKTNSQSNHLPNVDINNSVPRARANTMPKLQPQPKYNMSDNVCRQQSGESSLSPGTLIFTSYPAQKNQQQLPASPENPYVQYQYGNLQQQQQSLQMQQSRQQAQDGLSTAVNQNKTIFQLLGQQRNGTLNPAHSPQLASSRQQSNSVPMQDQRADGSMQAQSFGVQNGADFSPLSNNSKFLTDLNSIDNQDMFDPGSLDIEQMLQDIRSPENDSLGMEFNSYFPQGNIDLNLPENLMDTNGGSLSGNGLGNINETPAPGYRYSTTRVANEGNFVQQQPQQQRYTQPFSMYNSANHGADLLIGSNTPSSASMLISQPTSSALASHFNHTHQMIRPQSSMGTISDYRM